MISILVAAARSVWRSRCSGTPVAIRAFRTWGWGQRIREDGPHTHIEKMGTPTMGGIVMLVGARRRLPRDAAHDRRRDHVQPRGTRPDPRRGGVRARGLRRRLPEGPAEAIARAVEDAEVLGHRHRVGALRARRRRVLRRHRHVDELSFVRPTALELGVFFYVWVFVVLTSSSHAVNLTDGLDGLAAGSSILVLAAIRVHRVLAVPAHLRRRSATPTSACYGVDRLAMQDTAIVAAAMMGAATGFLWWNAAPARIFMGDTGALALGGLLRRHGDHDEHAAAADHPRRSLRDRDDVGDPPGDLVPRVREAGLPDVADPSPLRARRGGPSSP